jgi:hypothetical protein
MARKGTTAVILRVIIRLDLQLLVIVAFEQGGL